MSDVNARFHAQQVARTQKHPLYSNLRRLYAALTGRDNKVAPQTAEQLISNLIDYEKQYPLSHLTDIDLDGFVFPDEIRIYLPDNAGEFYFMVAAHETVITNLQIRLETQVYERQMDLENIPVEKFHEVFYEKLLKHCGLYLQVE